MTPQNLIFFGESLLVKGPREGGGTRHCVMLTCLPAFLCSEGEQASPGNRLSFDSGGSARRGPSPPGKSVSGSCKAGGGGFTVINSPVHDNIFFFF